MRRSVKVIEVENMDQGQRIDNYLFKYFKRVPKSRVYRSIRSGEVRINGKRVKPTCRLAIGDMVRVPPIQQATEVAGQDELVMGHQEKEEIKKRVI